MLAFLLPIAQKIITDAVAKIPDDEELGEKGSLKCASSSLKKAVKLTKTDMDDRLLHKVEEGY